MSKRARFAVLLAAIAVAVVALDQWTKYLARVHLSTNEVYRFLPGVLEFQLHMNDGASLGMFGGNRALLVGVSAVASIAVAAVMFCYKKLSGGERIGLALILGGAVGNLIDRAASGLVTDMLYFPWIEKIPLMPSFVCNVADIAITFGVATLIIGFIVDDVRERRAKKSSAEGGNGLDAAPHDASDTPNDGSNGDE